MPHDKTPNAETVAAIAEIERRIMGRLARSIAGLDANALWAATGQAVLTADNLESAKSILRDIWKIRDERSDDHALIAAECLTAEPGDWDEDEESEPQEPTPETIEAGRELMGRLVPVPVKQTARINVRDMTREDLDRLLALGEKEAPDV